MHAEASRLSVEWQAVEERAIGLAEIEIGRRFNEFAERRLAHLEQSVTETMANRERMEGQRLEASMTMTATRFGSGLMKLYELERRIEALENRTQ